MKNIFLFLLLILSISVIAQGQTGKLSGKVIITGKDGNMRVCTNKDGELLIKVSSTFDKKYDIKSGLGDDVTDWIGDNDDDITMIVKVTNGLLPNVRLNMNPAFQPDKGFAKIIALGGIGTNFSSNSLTLDKLIYPNPDGEGGCVSVLDSRIDGDEFLSSLEDKNKFNLSFRGDLLGFGWYNIKY